MSGVSGDLLDHHARQLVAGIDNLQTALDIGPGRGKYGRMIREVGHVDATLIGVEAEPTYIADYELHHWYDQVFPGPGIQVLAWPNASDARWDLVTLGDVLEHMRKSDGLDLMHYLIYRVRYMWIVWPMRYIQGALGGHPSEAHVSVWTEMDIRGLNADYVKFESAPLEGYAINGYPDAGRRVEEILGMFPQKEKKHASS